MITSTSNPLIKTARALRDTHSRRRNELFLIEGVHLVGAALEAGWELEALLYAPEQLESAYGNELVEGFPGHKEAVSIRVLESIGGKDHPQGILALARRRVGELKSAVSSGCMVALERTQDPGNLGTVLRTVDAVGGTHVFLLDVSVDPYHPTAVRAAMGATFTVPFTACPSAEFLEWTRTHQVFLLGTSARASLDYRKVRPERPFALLFGNEQKGLSEELRNACSVLVSLPMSGRASSLNLAVAAGVLLYSYCT